MLEKEGRGDTMMKRYGILLMVMGLIGCLGPTGKAPLVRQYVFEYAPPRAAGGAVIEEMLTVERFAAARLHTSSAMVYREGPFLQDTYHEHRWRVPPAEMVADFLRRDLKSAGLFRAVIPPREAEETRFVLEGGVEEFLEIDEGQMRKALLVVTLTLLDLSRREVPARVVFQKTYRNEVPFKTDGAPGLAEAMSRAMAQLSAQSITDIEAGLKRIGR
jgi:ABC-type uncharacterized transport system auxiliary subunit